MLLYSQMWLILIDHSIVWNTGLQIILIVFSNIFNAELPLVILILSYSVKLMLLLGSRSENTFEHCKGALKFFCKQRKVLFTSKTQCVYPWGLINVLQAQHSSIPLPGHCSILLPIKEMAWKNWQECMSLTCAQGKQNKEPLRKSSHIVLLEVWNSTGYRKR